MISQRINNPAVSFKTVCNMWAFARMLTLKSVQHFAVYGFMPVLNLFSRADFLKDIN
jgi:hypothetical protein